MKKLFKTLAVLLIAILLSMSSFACVGPGKGEQFSKDALNIRVFDGGYSISWINKIARAFTQETGIKTVIKSTAGDTGGWESELNNGTSSVDIYFNNNTGFSLVSNEEKNTMVADLTDMFNTLVPGESILYKDKMIDTVRNSLNFDYEYDYNTKTYSSSSQNGKYYTTSWANGSLSFAVNMDKWDVSYGEFPNTTDELFALCDKILEQELKKSQLNRMYPFTYSKESSYWKFIFETWQDQYLGKDGVDAYNAGYDKNGEQFTAELLQYDAFKETLKCLQSCLEYKTRTYYEKSKVSYTSPDSLTNSFGISQLALLKGYGLMQPNGNWLITEMNSKFKGKLPNIQFKKVPVISSIIDLCTTIEDDAELSALISAIDKGETSLKGEGYDVNQEDFDRIYFARRVLVTMGNTHGAYIPKYSRHLDWAKSFLLFMAKDSSLETYYKETLGSTLPFVYNGDNDYSGVDYTPSGFIQSEREMMKISDVRPCLMGASNKLLFFRATGFNPMGMPYEFENKTETYLSGQTSEDFLDAEQIFNMNYQYAVDNWAKAYSPYAW